MSKLSKRLQSAVPRHLLPSSHAAKRVISNFAEEYGLVYFGYVSQRNDDHHIVRGLTVSNQHVDDHYCIGSYDGCDVIFVERRDQIRGHEHVWHIMEFDLATQVDVPHVFIGSETHGKGFHELLKTKFPSLLPSQLGATVPYPDSFNRKNVVYTGSSHLLDLERIITPAVAEVIASHFNSLVIEIADGCLYLYSEKNHASADLLVSMLKNGVWLAKSIDINNRSD